MIETKDITKMVAHILRRDKGIADTHIMHPAREWFIGLGIATFLVAAGSWFCFHLYYLHTNEMLMEVVIVEQTVPYQAATVKNALELFARKQQIFNEILGTAENVAPPTTTPETTIEAPATVPMLIIDPPPVISDEDSVESVLAL